MIKEREEQLAKDSNDEHVIDDLDDDEYESEGEF